jgi:hypothetical protein
VDARDITSAKINIKSKRFNETPQEALTEVRRGWPVKAETQAIRVARMTSFILINIYINSSENPL